MQKEIAPDIGLSSYNCRQADHEFGVTDFDSISECYVDLKKYQGNEEVEINYEFSPDKFFGLTIYQQLPRKNQIYLNYGKGYLHREDSIAVEYLDPHTPFEELKQKYLMLKTFA